MLNWIQAVSLFAATFLAAFFCTWLVRLVMRKARIFDVPTDGRKAHRAPVAYEGGLAIWLAVLCGLAAAMRWVPSLIFENQLLQGIIIGGTLTVAVGAADDLLDLKPWLKLLSQAAIGVVMYYYGFRVERFSNPFGEEVLFYEWISLAGTCFWYALLINGINMIDGMDGLAAGIVAISALTLCAISVNLNVQVAVILALLLCASCLGFLPFNFSPATIFMGDAGSMLLGFMLASITLLSSTKSPALLALIIPMLALGLPIFETGFAFIRRLLEGQHPFKADRRHLHHRFLALGFSERRTVLNFYYITAYFGITAFVLQRLEVSATLPLVAIIGIGMLVLVENMRFLERAIK